MINVYVVIGTTGEYSDRVEWTVAAYLDEANAKRHRDAASQAAAKIHKDRINKYHVPQGINPHDPEMRMDYTGTDYEIWPVPLRDVI